MNGVGGSEAIRRRGGGCCGRGRRAVCCSFVLNLVVVVLLTAAASSPWYATSSRHVPPTSGALVTTTDRLLLWYWSGLSIHTTSSSAYAPSVPTPAPNTTASIAATNSALVQVMTTMTTTANHMKAVASVSSAGWPVVFHEAGDGTSTSWETIGWDDRRYGLGAAKSIYSASNAMALVGLGFALLLALFLFYGVASCPGPRMTFHRHYTHCKSFISCLSALTFVFTCLAWGLFLYFPTALGNRCVPKFTCDMFFGSASQRNNNPPELLEAVWSPFVGWALALLSTPFAFLALVVACFVQKPPPPARDYRLVIN